MIPKVAWTSTSPQMDVDPSNPVDLTCQVSPTTIPVTHLSFSTATTAMPYERTLTVVHGS